jgi:hypothetical protein
MSKSQPDLGPEFGIGLLNLEQPILEAIWMDHESRIDIIARYGFLLGRMTFTVGRSRDLPVPEGVIFRALLEELLSAADPQVRTNLEIGIVSLQSFVSDHDFEIVSSLEVAARQAVKTESETLASDKGHWGKYVAIIERIQGEQEKALNLIRQLFPIADMR